VDDWRYEPSRDLGLGPADRLRSLRRESGLIESAGHVAWWSLIGAYLRWVHRFDLRGRLPAEPPFVLVANHASHLDVLSLLAPLPWRIRDRVFALAAGDAFFESAASSVFSAFALNALPVWRKKFDPEHFASLRRRLVEEPCAYALFPEGTRTRDGRMGRFKRGIGMLVAGTSVPVYPCRLDGTYASWPARARWPRPGRVRLQVGEPLRFEAEADDAAGWSRVAAALEQSVRALKGANKLI
jgi:1-acyl-sn-glycerol-3-phosphate acyltransferase